MKRRTKEQIAKRFTPLLKNFNGHCWIAGGAIVSMIIGKPINDTDMYFESKRDRLIAAERFANLGSTYVKKLRLGGKFSLKEQEFDLLHLGKTPEETINNFDYTICCVAFDNKGELYCHPSFWEDIKERKLVYTGNNTTHKNCNKAKRLVKYLSKGFSIDDRNIHKLFKD
jgi:hypothetical protein